MRLPEAANATKIAVESSKAFKAGKSETQPFIVPVGAEYFRLRLPRNNLPVAKQGKYVIRVQAWISYDGGRKFDLLIGFTTNGGDIIDPMDGKAFIESTVTRKIKPQYKTNDRVMKVLVDAVEDMTASINVEFW